MDDYLAEQAQETRERMKSAGSIKKRSEVIILIFAIGFAYARKYGWSEGWLWCLGVVCISAFIEAAIQQIRLFTLESELRIVNAIQVGVSQKQHSLGAGYRA